MKEKSPIETRICPQCNVTLFLEAEGKNQIFLYISDVKIFNEKITCKSSGYKFP
ncbi:MAG: hypothetical protein ACFFAN_17180 [Promethearchaeota archaeon]